MTPLSASLRAATRDVVLGAGPRLPRSAVAGLLRRATRGLEVALCLHRVGPVRATDPLPWMTIPEDTLDDFLELARGVRLTVTFDDGYADAVAWLRARAPRHPEVDFVLFVCPEKLETRAGFRWDLFERRRAEGADPGPLRPFVDAPFDPGSENHRPELVGLADRPELALATVEACQEMAALRNVRLGDHGDTHLRLTGLAPEVARAELEASAAHFAARFGPAEDFAFPFGVPGRDYDGTHVATLRRLGYRRLWSTAPRAFRPEARSGSQVLPRFPVMGNWHAKALAVWVAASAMRRGPLEDPVLDEIAAGALGQ